MIKPRKMKTYYLKIREKFISSIQKGAKKHEYRLAKPERRSIKVGDNLVLISNQDKKNYVRTTVTGISIYKTWKEALEKNWKEDFAGIFETLESAIRECQSFYDKEQVDEYGIIVYDINPVIVNYSKEPVLLDTNIVIKRESINNASSEVSKLFNWFDKKQISKYIHKLTIEEISKYGNKVLKDNILTKTQSYNVLPDFRSQPDDFFTKVVSKYSNNENSKNDNALLLEVYNDNVRLLITDDFLMLRKAEELFIRENVLSSNELLTIYENASPKNIDYKVLNAKLMDFRDVDLSDSFFESLRKNYGGQKFDRWFKRKALEGEQAYVCRENGVLKGFLYLKTEEKDEKDYLDVEPTLRPIRRLKVGTFKVVHTGYRLGERFIKIIMDKAVKEKVDEVYVTLYENREEDIRHLQILLSEWGFCRYGYKKSTKELVMVKSMVEYDYSKDPKFNYPLLNKNATYRFLPIMAKYHTDLFPDNILKNEDASLYEGNLAHRYAQEKIYLTGAFFNNAKPGDIVLIYRMSDEWYKRYSSVVTGTAIIQSITQTKDVEHCIKICKNRSIFREEEIRAVYSKYPVVVNLLALETFPAKVTLDFMRAHNIIAEGFGPRPFRTLTKEEFDLICKKGTGEE